MDISNLTTVELKELLARIPKEIERRQKDEKSALVKKLESIAAESGFTLNSLVGGIAETPKKERKAVAIKYRSPENAELTWTGRGLKPKWIKEFLENGGNLESLAV